jgi:hypothetical protein
MKFLITQLSPSSWHFFPLYDRRNYKLNLYVCIVLYCRYAFLVGNSDNMAATRSFEVLFGCEKSYFALKSQAYYSY